MTFSNKNILTAHVKEEETRNAFIRVEKQFRQIYDMIVLMQKDIDNLKGGGTSEGKARVEGAFTTVSATGDVTLEKDTKIRFEGSTENTLHTIITVEDPTAERTITLPNASDTVLGKTTIDTLENKTITNANNTVHADQFKSTKTITITGDASGTVQTDFSGVTTLNLSIP